MERLVGRERRTSGGRNGCGERRRARRGECLFLTRIRWVFGYVFLGDGYVSKCRFREHHVSFRDNRRCRVYGGPGERGGFRFAPR